MEMTDKIYRKGAELEVREYNFLLDRGGLGDLIARLPAIKYVLEHHPQLKINLYVHQYGVELCKKLLPYENLVIASIDDANIIYNDKLPGRSPDRGNVGNLSMHMTHHAFMTLAHREVEDKYKNYLKLEPIDITHLNIPDKAVVITTGFTSNTREWDAQSVNETVDYLLARGYTPVFLGKSYTHAYKNDGIVGNFKADYDKAGTINLIDKTNLFEAHAIMHKSGMVLGLDNGLLHLAALSEETKLIYGFTTVLPEHRLPYRKDEMGYKCFVVAPTKEELRCIGCQSTYTFAPPTHDFRDCFYTDYACIKLMKSNKWIDAFNKAVAAKTPQEKAEQAYKQIQSTQELNNKLKELGISVK